MGHALEEAYEKGPDLLASCSCALVPTCMRLPPIPSLQQQPSRPPLPPDFYQESLLDKVALQLFRQLVQKEIGFVSSKEGYDGLIEEARYYQMKPGVTIEDQQQMVRQTGRQRRQQGVVDKAAWLCLVVQVLNVLNTIAGPVLPAVYRTFMAPFFWAPFLTALFTPPIFKFLVGPNKLDLREDGMPGGR